MNRERTPKGSHVHNRRSRPAVTIVRPLWGLTEEGKTKRRLPNFHPPPTKTSNDREPEGWPVVACTI